MRFGSIQILEKKWVVGPPIDPTLEIHYKGRMQLRIIIFFNCQQRKKCIKNKHIFYYVSTDCPTIIARYSYKQIATESIKEHFE